MRFRHGFWLLSTSKQEQLKHLNNFCLLIWLAWQCSNKDLLNFQEREKGNLNIGMDSFFFPPHSPFLLPHSICRGLCPWDVLGSSQREQTQSLQNQGFERDDGTVPGSFSFGSSPWFTLLWLQSHSSHCKDFWARLPDPFSKMNPAVLHSDICPQR